MNKKLLIGLLVIVVLALGLRLVWRPRGGTPTATLVPKPSQPSTATQTQTGRTNGFEPADGSAVKDERRLSKADEMALLQIPGEKRARFLKREREIAASSNYPMSFYGRILDQNGQPVAGVLIKGKYTLAVWTFPWSEPELRKVDFTSDANGYFKFDGVKGLALMVQLQPKDGYEFKGGGYLGVSFQEVGAPPVSTPDKPYIFHAFRKGKAEPLIKGGLNLYDCISDGRWYTVDLKGKKTIEGEGKGEFKISFVREPGPMGHTNRDWAVRIEGINTDLLESDEIFMYQAPEGGYQSSWHNSQKAGEPKYKRDINRKFYLKGRDGSLYGQMEIAIRGNSREGSAADIRYYLNPAGSRNLEPDPKLTFPDLESYNRYMVEHGGKPVVLESASPKP